MSPGERILVAVTLVLGGAAILFFCGREVIRAHESVRWPIIEGHVVRSEVIVSQNTRKLSTTTSYIGKVIYNYRLSDVLYSSDRVHFSTNDFLDFSHFSDDPASIAQADVDRYPVGMSVHVHYNPESPELSVLEPGVRGNAYLLLAIGLVLFVVGCKLLRQ